MNLHNLRAFPWPRAIAGVVASAIITSYMAGDIFIYLAVLLVLFVLSPGAH